MGNDIERLDMILWINCVVFVNLLVVALAFEIIDNRIRNQSVLCDNESDRKKVMRHVLLTKIFWITRHHLEI